MKVTPIVGFEGYDPSVTPLVLLRHGTSTANAQKRFGGWEDVPLTIEGVIQAHDAGATLKQFGLKFDVAYVSALRRARDTLSCCLQSLGQADVAVHTRWRLNERHYGALQGHLKAEMAARFGEAQVREWRRGYRATPPPLGPESFFHLLKDSRYFGIDAANLPVCESLHDVVQRVRFCWTNEILPSLQRSRSTLIVAHGNSLRALLMLLLGISEDDIAQVEIPNGAPLLFGIDQSAGALVRYAAIVGLDGCLKVPATCTASHSAFIQSSAREK